LKELDEVFVKKDKVFLLWWFLVAVSLIRMCELSRSGRLTQLMFASSQIN
jgi:hypothetical protein